MMIFTADREVLAQAIRHAAEGLPAHPVLPVHAGMLVQAGSGTVNLTAGDEHMMFTAETDGQIAAPGGIIVPGRLLAEISRYLTGAQITIRQEDGRAEIISGRSRFTLSAAPESEYPGWDDPPELAWELRAPDFRDAVRRVIPAASRTEALLSTICLTPHASTSFTMTCTNRASMAVAKLIAIPVTGDVLPAALLPVITAERFARTLEGGDVQIGWDDHLICLHQEGLTVTVRQIAGTYLPWEAVMAKQPAQCAVADTAELARAVKMALLAAGDDGTVSVSFAPGEIHVQGSGNGSCSEYLDTDYDGDTVRFLCGAQMLLDGLGGCGAQAKLAFTTALAPVFMSGDNFTFMLKPRHDLTERT